MSWVDDNKHRIIMDLGSHNIKSGLADSENPTYKIENLAGLNFYLSSPIIKINNNFFQSS